MRIPAIFVLMFLLLNPASVQAQSDLPTMPEALQVLVDRGAQARYLGKSHGMDGWITVYKGQEQYYYVTPDGQGFLMGILFDKDGKAITIQQVSELQKQGDEVLDFLAVDKVDKNLTEKMQETNEVFKYKTPAERMFGEVENSNWVSFGSKNAPVIYSFMDPQCPHCHDFMDDLRQDYIGKGLIQLRMIPVGFRDETLAQAAFLIAAPDAQERWYDHLDGVETALPAKNTISTQAVQKNLALMQAWKFGVTPMTIYRDKSDKIKIVRGRAGEMSDILADLPVR